MNIAEVLEKIERTKKKGFENVISVKRRHNVTAGRYDYNTNSLFRVDKVDGI